MLGQGDCSSGGDVWSGDCISGDVGTAHQMLFWSGDCTFMSYLGIGVLACSFTQPCCWYHLLIILKLNYAYLRIIQRIKIQDGEIKPQ